MEPYIPSLGALLANLWVTGCGVGWLACILLAGYYYLSAARMLLIAHDESGVIRLLRTASILAIASIAFGGLGVLFMNLPVEVWPDPATDLIPPPVPAPQPTPVIQA